MQTTLKTPNHIKPNHNKTFPIGMLQTVTTLFEDLHLTPLLNSLKHCDHRLSGLVIGLTSYKMTEDLSVSRCHNWMTGNPPPLDYLLEYLGHKDWKLKLPVVEELKYDTLTEDERERYIDTVNKNCENILYKDASELTPREIKHIMDRAIALIQTMSASRPRERYAS